LQPQNSHLSTFHLPAPQTQPSADITVRHEIEASAEQTNEGEEKEKGNHPATEMEKEEPQPRAMTPRREKGEPEEKIAPSTPTRPTTPRTPDLPTVEETPTDETAQEKKDQAEEHKPLTQASVTEK
jgi:hypothetical protein